MHNSFSYHLTPAGSMMETGAQAIGCTVFAGGVGNTELQLQAMQELRPDAYAGTPSFLRIVLEKADEAGLTLPSLRKASVGGEAFPPALRDCAGARAASQAYQSYGTADLGLIAYETVAARGPGARRRRDRRDRAPGHRRRRWPTAKSARSSSRR